MSNLQTYYNFKLDFLNMGQHIGGGWSIHGTKHGKDNQLQSPKAAWLVKYSKIMSRGVNLQGGANLKIQKYLKKAYSFSSKWIEWQ